MREQRDLFPGVKSFELDDTRVPVARPALDAELINIVEKAAPYCLVSGPHGSGKTSLVTLVLRRANISVPRLYIDLATAWKTTLRHQVMQLGYENSIVHDQFLSPDVVIHSALEAPIILIVDHLERYEHLSRADQDDLNRLLRKVAAGRGHRVLLCIDSNELKQLGKIDALPDRIAPTSRMSLPMLTIEQTADFISSYIQANGGNVESAAAERLAHDLCRNGEITPAKVHKVGHAAGIKHTLSKKTYDVSGGAFVLEQLYVDRVTAHIKHKGISRVLWSLSDLPDPHGRMSLQELEVKSGVRNRSLQTIIAKLSDASVTTRHGDFVHIAHPYLAVDLKNYSAEVAQARAKIKFELRKAVEKDKRLSLQNCLKADKYLGTNRTDQETLLIRKSKRYWRMLSFAVSALPIMLILAGVAYYRMGKNLSPSYGLSGPQRVVLKKTIGKSPLSGILDSRLHTDTGILIRSLPEAFRKTLSNNKMWGHISKTWIDDVITQLDPARQSVFLTLLGRGQDASDILKKNIQQFDDQTLLRVLPFFEEQSDISKSIIERGINSSDDNARSRAFLAGFQLSDKHKAWVLKKSLADKNPWIRQIAVDHLAHFSPKSQSTALQSLLGDTDDRVRRKAEEFLNDETLTVADRYQVLSEFLTLDDESKPRITEKLATIREQHGPSVAAYLWETLSANILSNNWPTTEQYLDDLQPLAEHIAPPEIKKLLTSAPTAMPVYVHAGLNALLSAHEDNVAPTPKSTRNKQALPYAIMLEARTHKSGVPPLTRKYLESRNQRLRKFAISAILDKKGSARIDMAKLVELASPRSRLHIARALCTSLASPTKHAQTTLLSSLWDNMTDKSRRILLHCTPQFAKNNYKLLVWLSDKSAAQKSTQLHIAAAPVAARAIALKGRRAKRLANFYLGSDDTLVQNAMMRSLESEKLDHPTYIYSAVDRVYRSRVGSPEQRRAIPLMISSARNVSGQIALATVALSKLDGQGESTANILTAISTLSVKDTDTKLKQRLADQLSRVLPRLTTGQSLSLLNFAENQQLKTLLISATKDARPAVRQSALKAVIDASSTHKAKVKHVKEGLNDPASAVRQSVINLIATTPELHEDIEIEMLTSIIDRGDPAERNVALQALAKVDRQGNRELQNRFETYIHHPSESFREKAVQGMGIALSETPDAALEASLLDSLNDEAHDIRLSAYRALGAHYAKKDTLVLIEQIVANRHASATRNAAVIALTIKLSNTRLADKDTSLTTSLKQVEDAAKANTDPIISFSLRLAASMAKAHQKPDDVLSWLTGL